MYITHLHEIFMFKEIITTVNIRAATFLFSFIKYHVNSMKKWGRYLTINIATFTVDGKIGNTSNRNSKKVSVSSCENASIVLVWS